MAINSDRLSLFVMATGSRGSNKSLFLTSMQVMQVLKAYYSNHYLGTHKRVWSNYPVSFWHYSLIDHRVINLASEPLNREAFMVFDNDYCEGWVYIDEFDQWYDKQQWQNGDQKLTAKGVTQIRKRKLNLGGTMQNISWANGRLEFQVDIEVECKDAAFSPFGHKMNFDLGECAFLKWKDLSGVMTGEMFRESGMRFENTFWGKRFWNCYDTSFQFDPTESMTKYKIKRPTKVIDFSGQDDIQGNLPGNIMDPTLVTFSQIVDDFKHQGYNEVTKNELWEEAKKLGFKGEWYQAGKALSKLGVMKGNSRATKYILEDPSYPV